MAYSNWQDTNVLLKTKAFQVPKQQIKLVLN